MGDKIDIALLIQRFGPPQNIAPFGQVLLIPGDSFDPDWEVQLGDQGYKCHTLEFHQKPVTIVELKKLNAGKTVYVPPPIPAFNPNTEGQARWNTEEDRALYNLLHGVKYGRNRILKEAMKKGTLPGRTVNGALQRFDKALRNKPPSYFTDPPPPSQASTSQTPQDQRIIEMESTIGSILLTLHELAEKIDNSEVALCKEINDLQQQTVVAKKNLHDHEHLPNGRAVLTQPLPL